MAPEPLIITEFGSYRHINGVKDLTGFEKNRTNILYTYVNMVYPQINGVIYFDYDRPGLPMICP